MQNEEYIIGRNAQSAVKIPEDKVGVGTKHLKITVAEDGSWILEDLDSANGTYVRDESGDFHRIFKKQIKQSDIIRLGPGGANSFTFMANRVLNPSNYQYEFKHLKHTLRNLKETEEKEEAKIRINGWITRSAGIVIAIICVILEKAGIFTIDPNYRYFFIAGGPVLAGLFFGDQAKKLRALRNKRVKFMVCPCCGKQISEFDIEEGQCSRCKAK